MSDMRMRYFNNLHPAVSMSYFITVLAFTLACFHPVMAGLSLMGSAAFSFRLRGKKAFFATLRFIAPMFLFIAIANPLFNHRGVTMLFLLFDQWITLEAILYGLVSACTLCAIVMWFTCYQEVMTSDKFLYLFGKLAPATALLITMTLRFVPELKQNAREIRNAQKMLRNEDTRLFQKLGTAMRNLSVLLTMSMESAVGTADSMKARGYGEKRRTTFHLFRFDGRDTRVLALMLTLAGICFAGRIYGHGYMEFYPAMTAAVMGTPSVTMFVVFGLLMALPTFLEAKETVIWRSYGLKS
ncbi:MAG: energy-coupling factor transporter transmembrane component T [Saccharofermentanales bacterium]|jgi:energy-coupling factor transport system permease protein|nr:energy-coupling factor transporter transmembrane component T [Bacillota bacterium]